MSAVTCTRSTRFLLILLFLLPTIALAQSYVDSLASARDSNDLAIREETIGPFTAIGQASLRDGQALRISLFSDTLLLGHPTADLGIANLEVIWKKDDGIAYLRTPQGRTFTMGRQTIGPIPLAYTPGDTVRAGHYLIQIYLSPNGARLMAFDPMAPGRTEFKGLHWYNPDPGWRVTARVEPISDPDTVAMTTSLGLTKFYVQKARLYFTSPTGQEGALTLFGPAQGPQYGFLPFTDATTGVDTYGAGRYLDLEPPEEGAETMEIDFNQAYNPYCAYTHFYNCPIPPAENQLEFEVKAGEKTYK